MWNSLCSISVHVGWKTPCCFYLKKKKKKLLRIWFDLSTFLVKHWEIELSFRKVYKTVALNNSGPTMFLCQGNLEQWVPSCQWHTFTMWVTFASSHRRWRNVWTILPGFCSIYMNLKYTTADPPTISTAWIHCRITDLPFDLLAGIIYVI